MDAENGGTGDAEVRRRGTPRRARTAPLRPNRRAPGRALRTVAAYQRTSAAPRSRSRHHSSRCFAATHMADMADHQAAPLAAGP